MDERWLGDERGGGISSGEPFAPPLRALLEEMSREDWNTEQPDAHLLPHLERAIAGSELSLVGTRVEDEVFVVELSASPVRGPQLRASIYPVIASIAEPTTAIVEREDADAFVFDVVLALARWQTDAFPKGHGHLVRFRVSPA